MFLFLLGFFSLIIFIIVILIFVKYKLASNTAGDNGKGRGQAVLGKIFVKATPVPTLTITPTPTIFEYSITLISVPKELTEGDNTTFTWSVNGLPTTIHTSAIYYGTTSDSGALTKNASPDDTSYTGVVKDFIQGSYDIPLQFVGNARYAKPGTYFFRGYALINGKHYWTEERTFIVKPIPKNEIRIINPPTKLNHGENVTFTWDIIGPNATTGFSAIVAGKVSKPGPLDATIDTTMTPYSIIVHEYTAGTFNIPLRFIGNTSISEPGVYYFRAIAFINGKNIWSDEYSFNVQ